MLSLGQSRPEKLRRGDRLAAGVWALCSHFFSFLGPRFTFWAFQRVGRALVGRSSNVGLVRKNVDLVFPDRTAEARERLVQQIAGDLPLAIAELWLQPYWRRRSEALTRHNLDADWLQPFARNERQAVFLLGHFSGWEANIMTLSRHIRNVTGIYAPPKNALLEPYFRERRTDLSGNWTLYPRDMKMLQRRLTKEFAQGKSLIYALDAPLPGPMLPFLGLTSPTALRPYELAAKAGAPIIPLQYGRDRAGIGFWISALEPLYAKSAAPEHVRDLATRMNALYSDWIRANPDQWYWTGRFFRPNPQWEARNQKRGKPASSADTNGQKS